MNSCIVLLVLIFCAAAAAGPEKCLKKVEETGQSAAKEKIKADCKKENPKLEDKDMGKCYYTKIIAANKACNNTKYMSMENALCQDKQLGTTTETLYDFKKFKTHVLDHALDEKKKAMEEAMTPCEKEKYYVDCADINLAKVCVEYKDLVEMMEEKNKKKQ